MCTEIPPTEEVVNQRLIILSLLFKDTEKLDALIEQSICIPADHLRHALALPGGMNRFYRYLEHHDQEQGALLVAAIGARLAGGVAALIHTCQDPEKAHYLTFDSPSQPASIRHYSLGKQMLTPLEYAVAVGNPHWVEALLQRNASLGSALLIAATLPSPVILKRLLNLPQIDLEISTPGGITPLIRAIQANQPDNVRLLINHGANREVKILKPPKLSCCKETELGIKEYAAGKPKIQAILGTQDPTCTIL